MNEFILLIKVGLILRDIVTASKHLHVSPHLGDPLTLFLYPQCAGDCACDLIKIRRRWKGPPLHCNIERPAADIYIFRNKFKFKVTEKYFPHGHSYSSELLICLFWTLSLTRPQCSVVAKKNWYYTRLKSYLSTKLTFIIALQWYHRREWFASQNHRARSAIYSCLKWEY